MGAGVSPACGAAAIRDRARSYLGRLPVSLQGQGGHNAAFHAACVLVNGFSLPEQEALPLLAEWNTRCLPPWSEKELRHKLRSAAKNPGGKPHGHLVEKSFSSSRRSGRHPQKTARETQALQLAPLTHDDIRAIAALRGILPDAVTLRRGTLFLNGWLRAVCGRPSICPSTSPLDVRVRRTRTAAAPPEQASTRRVFPGFSPRSFDAPQTG